MTRFTTVALVFLTLTIAGLTGVVPVAAHAGAVLDFFDGWLNDDDDASHDLWLAAGRRVVIRGTCDSDCRDLDLVLRNPAGRVVDYDRDSDDVPYIDYTATTSGLHRLGIEMYRCDANPCGYDVNVDREPRRLH